MQLRKSVPICVENHDATGFRHVHADLDYRGRYQNRRYAGFKIGHNLRFCGVIVAPGQCCESNAFELRQRLQTLHDFCDGMQRGALRTLVVVFAKIVCLVKGGNRRACGFRIRSSRRRQRVVRIFGIIVDARADHVGAFPRVNAFTDQGEHFAHQRRIAFRHHECANWPAAARKFSQRGNIKITEPGHGCGARNRRGRHDQQMRRSSPLGIQRFALLHTEAMLFVDYRQCEVRCLEILGKCGVRRHDDAGHARCGCGKYATAFGQSHASRKKKYGNLPIFCAEYIVSFAWNTLFLRI